MTQVGSALGEQGQPIVEERNRVYAELTSSRDTVKSDEVVSLNLKVHTEGPIRRSLNQESWTNAYGRHDVSFLIRFYVRLLKMRGPLGKEILKAYVRHKAKFYWSRDPQKHNQIWIMTVDEFGSPSLPRTEHEAQSALFDLSKSFEVLGADIGKGRHRLVAQVKVKWGRHTFTDAGSVSCRSNPIYLSVG